MSKVKPFQLIYKVDAETLENVIALVFELHENTGMEPQYLRLSDDTVIKWNPFLAHNFVAKGRISEKESIEMCK